MVAKEVMVRMEELREDVGGGRWEVGGGRWEVGGGRWEVGGGRWEVGGDERYLIQTKVIVELFH